MSEPLHRDVTACRICGSAKLARVLTLGETPLANSFVRPDATEYELRFPLELLRCDRCSLVQLSVVVRPDVLFRTYAYASSASIPLRRHFDELAAELAARFALSGSLIVEIGSNDGILLRPLASRGARVLGIEPATNLAAQANALGLETWNDFFGPDVARRAARERGPAHVVVANNVLAHIDDLAGAVAGLDALLAPDGVFVAEVPYLPDLVDQVQYDTIYHEHLSYFALGPLADLFEGTGLELFDARRLPIHGGSIRIYAGRVGVHPRTSVLAALEESERRAGLDRASTYEAFADRVVASRHALRTLLAELKASSRRIAGYGATAKGNTLLNYCGIGTETLEFIVDTTPFKQGLLTPGTHVPVVPEEWIETHAPDYALLLAWNYADSIVARNVAFRRTGGRFIHPIPLARILEA